MYYIDTIGTHPAKQGHGYGSILTEVVLDETDANSKATWLISSNVGTNTRFYNRLGFVTVKEVIVAIRTRNGQVRQ